MIHECTEFNDGKCRVCGKREVPIYQSRPLMGEDIYAVEKRLREQIESLRGQIWFLSVFLFIFVVATYWAVILK